MFTAFLRKETLILRCCIGSNGSPLHLRLNLEDRTDQSGYQHRICFVSSDLFKAHEIVSDGYQNTINLLKKFKCICKWLLYGASECGRLIAGNIYLTRCCIALKKLSYGHFSITSMKSYYGGVVSFPNKLKLSYIKIFKMRQRVTTTCLSDTLISLKS